MPGVVRIMMLMPLNAGRSVDSPLTVRRPKVIVYIDPDPARPDKT